MVLRVEGGGGGGVSYEVYEVTDLANAELDIPPKNCYRLVVLGEFFLVHELIIVNQTCKLDDPAQIILKLMFLATISRCLREARSYQGFQE